MFYPLWLGLLAIAPANQALKVGLFLHLAACFAGQYRLARVLGVGTMGSSLAAVLLVQSGFVVNHLEAGHVNLIVGEALVPWFLLFLDRLLEQPGPSAAARVGLVGALMGLGSHPQMSYYTCLTGVGWSAAAVLTAKPRSWRGRQVFWLVLAALLAAATSAVQLAPAIELACDGLAAAPRGGIEHASSHAWKSADFLCLLSPNVLGNPFVGTKQFEASDFFHEHVAYLGLAAPLLAFYGLTRAEVARWQWALVVAVMICLLLAAGNATWLFDVAGRALPGWSWFRCPGRIFGLISVFTSLLAARGADAFVNTERASRVRWPAAPFITVSILAAGITVLYRLKKATFDWEGYRSYVLGNVTTDFLVTVLIALATVGALLIDYRRKARRRVIAWIALFAAIFCDLGYQNARNFHLAEVAAYEIPASWMAISPPIRFVDTSASPFVPPQHLYSSRLCRTAIEQGRSIVGTNDGGVLPGALTRLYHAIERDASSGFALSACGCAYMRDTDEWVALNEPLDRVRFVPNLSVGLCSVPIEQIEARHITDIRRNALRVPVLRDEPRRLLVDCSSPTEGLLVVADTWYPGWTCEVDGRSARLEIPHGIFRGVRLRPGRHLVEMRFQPRSFVEGAVVSVAGLSILVALWLWGDVNVRFRGTGGGKGGRCPI